jgi:hypothetical protein
MIIALRDNNDRWWCGWIHVCNIRNHQNWFRAVVVTGVKKKNVKKYYAVYLFVSYD